MNIQVTYYSRSGNTKAVADAIAEAVDVKATPINEISINEKVDILFVGSAVYAAGISGDMKKFLDELNANNIGEVVVFSTSAIAKRAYPIIKKRLEKQGIKVSDDNFYCKGKPNADAIKAAKQFAKKICG